MLDERYEKAKKWLYEAGDKLSPTLGETLVSNEKTSHQDIVTKWDVFIEEYIRKRIHTAYPQDDIVAEESFAGGDPQSRDVWYLDPIDGTTNFVNQHKNFAISLAFYRDTKPVFGIVLDVAAGQMYHAYVGQGSFKDTKQLRISGNRAEIGVMLLTTPVINHAFLDWHETQAAFVQLAQDIRGVRSLGSVALELCALAEETYDIFLAMRTSPWDHNAARLILAEAGGVSYSLDGRNPDPAYSGSILACTCDTAAQIILHDYIKI